MILSTQLVKELAKEMGFDACGVTSPEPQADAVARFEQWIAEGKHGGMKYLEDFKLRSENFWQRFPDAKSVIVLGANYYSKSPSAEFLSQSPLSGRVARYAWGLDYHEVLRKKLEALIERLQNAAGSGAKFEICIDTKPVMERHYSQRAGLGFIGKQTQLLSLQFGPWLFLSELVTNLTLDPDQPFQGSCGTCRICIEECPTDAITEGAGIDARKCIAYHTIENKGMIPIELRSKIGNWVFGCDECLNVCPYTAKQKATEWTELTGKSGFGSSLDIEDLLHLNTQREYEKYFSGTAILRAKRTQLLRNACIVLGNSGNRQALPVLQKIKQESDPMIQDAAQWAIRQIE